MNLGIQGVECLATITRHSGVTEADWFVRFGDGRTMIVRCRADDRQRAQQLETAQRCARQTLGAGRSMAGEEKQR